MPQGSVLAGLRVVDFGSGPAAGLATTVLADFGADVIKVEPPTGDRFRTLAASPFWLRGKRSVVLDLGRDDDRGQADRLIAGADVVVVSGPPSRLAAWGIDGARLLERRPSLVHCVISGWGTTGPYAELAGYEGIVAAKAGRMAAFDVQLRAGRPVYAAVQVATHAASQAAVQGILAALWRRERTGRGDRVEASLAQALMSFDLVDVLARQLAERRGVPFVPIRQASPMPTLNYHPLRTADAKWIQCGNLLEHLFYSFLDAIDMLGELLIDERYQGSAATWTPEAIEEARDRILLRMQECSADEWMKIFADNGNVAAEPIITSAAGLEHPDLVHGRGLVEVVDPVHGPTTQIAPIAELVATPASVRAGAPLVGQHTAEVLAEVLAELDTAPSPTERTTAVEAQPGRPLEGITILDLSTIIAAPLGMAMLADLGARVIKIEPLGGDPFRSLGVEGRMAVKTNAGKESICIDLKAPRGQALIQELAAKADVLIHNFRGEVPDKLGIGFDQLHALNPNLIWAVVNGYGPHGPGAKRPATHPVIGAATGGVALQAGEALTRECPTLADVRENARQIMVANEANPDPNTSVVAASAVMLALFARERGAGGQMVRVNMQVANGWANHDDFLSYTGKPGRTAVDPGHHGLNAGYRLYPTADGWVFLAVTTDAEFGAFCTAIGREDLAADERFATGGARVSNDASLVSKLTEVFAADTAAAWEARLVTGRVACVRADGVDGDRFFTQDPHMVGNGWSPIVDHARFGRVQRWGAAVTVGGLNPDYRSAPLAGQHTDAILGELGYDREAIAELRASKVVTSEPIAPVD